LKGKGVKRGDSESSNPAGGYHGREHIERGKTSEEKGRFLFAAVRRGPETFPMSGRRKGEKRSGKKKEGGAQGS